MKRILACVLAVMLALTLLFAVSCGKEEENEATVTRSFVFGNDIKEVSADNPSSGENTMSERAILNLLSDGSFILYRSELNNDKLTEDPQQKGTYTLGENAEFDETITLTFANGDTLKDAVIIDGIFEAESIGMAKFYETAPVSVNGDVYVGYLTKTTGMGNMVYAYAIAMRDDNTFDLSIMQMATGMHIWDKTSGTYTKDGDKITFSYSVMDGEGGVIAENFESEGTITGSHTFSCGFNVGQTGMRASDAAFVSMGNLTAPVSAE